MSTWFRSPFFSQKTKPFQAMERLRAVGSKIAQLEARKRVAVEREDYDMAKALKVDIDKLRAAGDTSAVGDVADPRQPRMTDPEEVLGRVLSNKAAQQAAPAAPYNPLGPSAPGLETALSGSASGYPVPGQCQCQSCV